MAIISKPWWQQHEFTLQRLIWICQDRFRFLLGTEFVRVTEVIHGCAGYFAAHFHHNPQVVFSG